MANESVSVRFDAETSGYTSKVDAAAKSTEKLGAAAEKASKQGKGMGEGLGAGAEQATTRMGKLSDAVKKHGGAMEEAGKGLMIFGGALTGLAVGVGKAAIDWESAWAGVMKTVEASPEQFDKLEASLREMARTLPATHTEIAAVAEAAGQLGVKTEDIEGFTRTMIDLGETTNLTAEEAATELAQFMNIMQTSGDDVDRLGSALVDLGNNGASTEKDILHMGARVAAVGKQMGMSEDEVLSLSSAMSSLGIEAEAGGTAISMVMKKIDASVREGGDALQGWADAAGVSAEEFATLWREDAAQAMVVLTQHMGEVAASGGDVNKMLSDLGIKGVREADTMLRLAQSGTLLAESFETGSRAWKENMALAKEAEARYATAEAKISVAWNNIKDAAIDAGGAILPIAATFADGIAGIAQAFAALPGPVKSALGVLSGVVGVGALALGGMLKLAPAVRDTVTAFQELATKAPRAAGALKTIAGVAGGLGIGVVAAGALTAGLTALYNSTRDAAAGVDEMITSIDRFVKTGDLANIDEMFQFDGIISGVNGLDDALNSINVDTPMEHIRNFGTDLFGLENSTKQTRDAFNSLDEALAVMPIEESAAAFDQLRAEAEKLGHTDFSTWQEMEQRLPKFADAVRKVAKEMGVGETDADLFRVAVGLIGPEMEEAGGASEEAAGGIEAAGEAMEMTAEEAEALEKAIDNAIASIQSMGSEGRTLQASQDNFQKAIMAVTESIKENGKSLDGTTEKGLANREALRSLADAGGEAAAKVAEFGGTQEEVREALMNNYDALVTAGKQFGLTGEQAQALAKDLLGIDQDVDIKTHMDEVAANIAGLTKSNVEAIPENVQVIADMSPDAMEKAFKTAESIDAIDTYKKVDVAVDDNGTPGQVQSRVNAITGKTEYIFVTDDGTVQNVQRAIVRIDGKDVPVYVTDDGTVIATQGNIKSIQGKTVQVLVESNASAVQAQINSIKGKTVRVDVVRKQLGQAGVATGGIAGVGTFSSMGLPGHALGRLPYTGRGTDRILGVDENGWPVARVNDGEAIIREPMTVKHLGLLRAINEDDTKQIRKLAMNLPGHATGRIAPTREWSGNPAAALGLQSVKEERSFTSYQTISTQDPHEAAKVAVGDMMQAFKTQGVW